MRMRKRKWVDDYLKSDNYYLVDNCLSLDNIYLEIGMGMGDFIVSSAYQHPDRNYVGLEKDPTCVARAIKKAKELNVPNLKIIHNDAMNLLELFSPSSISEIYLHFSDPWPKKHHHKRRLTYNTFLSNYYYLLMDNGNIVFKTDNDDLYFDSLLYFENSDFKIVTKDEDYHKIKRDEPLTAYEMKFLESGVPIHYVKLKK